MARDIKIDPDKKDIVKRFNVSKEEQQRLMDIQGVLGIKNMEREGLQYVLVRQLAVIRKRLGIEEQDAPAGYERFVDLDDSKPNWEMMVIDRPILKEEPKADNVDKAPEKAIN